MQWIRNYRVPFYLVSCALFVSLYLYPPSPFKKLIIELEDFKFEIRKTLNLAPSIHKDIVIATVDEKSINALGRWPWNRKTIADIIASMVEAKLIIMDIVFSEPSRPEEDRYLAGTIARNNNVILGFFFRPIATEELNPESLPFIEDCALSNFEIYGNSVGLIEFPHVELNIPEISSAGLSCAFFNTEPDIDGLFRRYPIAYIFKGNIIPSLAVQGASYILNTEPSVILNKEGIQKFILGETTIEGTNYLRLNHYRDIIPVSAVDILNNTIAPSFFKDKIVIFGVTETGIYDLRPTPLDPFTPGVFLQGIALSNILRKEYLTDAKGIDVFLIFLTLSLVTALSMLKTLYKRLLSYCVVFFALVCVVTTLFITKTLWVHFSYPLIAGLISAAALELFAFFQADIQAEILRKAFSSYVAPEIIKEMISSPEKLSLGGEEKEVTILFTDIRGFTTASEKLPPEKLIFLLKTYMNPMAEIIKQNNGLLDKYIGDAIMALYNTPLSLEGHADKACHTALMMMEKLKDINAILKKHDIPAINIGIGINTGTAIVGNMGSTSRIEYTAIGDAVNLTSRIESLNKTYGCNIIVSEHTRNKLLERFLLRLLDKVIVKGKHIPVDIYELMRESDRNRGIKREFEEGMIGYFQGNFKRALDIFERIAQEYGDAPSLNHLQRCKYYMDTPPPKEWNKVFERRME